MKKLFLILFIVFVALSVNAQDVIFKRNGEEIKAKVSKVSETEIEYKKWSNQSGPSYTAKTSDVFMIKYENGEKDVFEGQTQSSGNDASKQESSKSNSGTQTLIEKGPAANNTELIRKYNPEIRLNIKPSNKASKWFFPIMAVSDSSILSTDDIEVSIVLTLVNKYYHMPCYHIEIKNKTSQTIYIDKANTFRIYADNSYKTYYDSDQINVSKGGSSGVGVNLGGIANVMGIGGIIGTLASSATVGGSSQGSVSQTYTQQRILAIPPHATAILSERKKANGKKELQTLLSNKS